MLLATYPKWTSTVTSSFSAVSKTHFFHFICVVLKMKIFDVVPLFCNDNNYMTYKWPNSSFFNFQENANQENCRQCSCIIFLIDKLEQRTWRKETSQKRIVFQQKKNFIQTQRVSAAAFIRGLYIGFINPLMISYCDVIKKCSLLD